MTRDGRAYRARETRFEGNLARIALGFGERSHRCEDSRGSVAAATGVAGWRTWRAKDSSSSSPLSRLDIPSVETTLKYQGYLKRQESDIQRRVARRASTNSPRVPIRSRSRALHEVIQRLSQVRPETIGQAMRVPGVTPAAIAVLSTYVSRHALKRHDRRLPI